MESRVGPPQEVTAELRDRRWRTRRFTACVIFLVVCMLQAPGRLVGDTKADLVIDPIGFMGRAFQIWDPSGFAGQVQNQAYGYLFPMGPFFALFDLIGTPGWVTQRLWWTALLTLAFLGANKLFERMGIGTEWSRFVGALAFALAPRILGVMGAASVEAYPAALTPWVLIPLVSLGSGRGVVRAAALSAIAVGLMGGVNAAVNLAAVMPAVLWFATRRWDRTTTRLAAWWALFVVMATSWWVLPLLTMGRYSSDFLDYIESAADTTKVTNLIETVRGTSHWVGFLSNGLGSIWQIGGDLVTNGSFIADTMVVAVASLIGIVLYSSVERLWVVMCLLVGVAMVTFGHINGIDGWFADAQQASLDGALAPLRNVHKFDVLIRLALSIGLVSLLTQLDLKRAWEKRAYASAFWSVTIAMAVVAVAAPAFVGRLAPTGSYVEVPDYWQEAGQWLEDNQDGRALVAPGARFGRYLWGTTNDEILQTLTRAEWEVRNAIPLTPTGHIRMLDAVERRFQAGQPSRGISDYLARNGIGYVVVRHDLSGSEAHARTGFVEQVLSQSPGFEMVKGIGPKINPDSTTATLNDANLSGARQAIEIWKVGSFTANRATLTAVPESTQVSGDAESLLDLADEGLLPEGATVMSGDLDVDQQAPTGPTIVTDSYRRREVNYGRIGNNQSSTLTEDDSLTIGRLRPDYTPYSVLEHGAVGEWEGVKSIRVTSSASDAGNASAIRPEQSLRAMFDADPESFWSAQAASAGTTQSLTITPGSTKSLKRITIQLPPNTGSQMGEISAIVDKRETVRATQDPQDRDKWVVDLDTTVSSQLQIDLTQKKGSFTPVRVSSMDIQGMPINYRIALPNDVSSGPDVIAATNAPGYNPGCVTVGSGPTRCSTTIQRNGEDDPGVGRTFAVDTGGDFDLAGSVAIRPGSEMNELFQDVAKPAVTAEVSSTAIDQPLANGFALLDNDSRTTWIAASADDRPTVRIDLDKTREVSRVDFDFQDGMPASRPASVLVRVGDQEFRRFIDADETVRFPATRADSVELEFTGDERTASFDPTTGDTGFISIGISGIEIGGVPDNSPPESRMVDFPCGRGPDVVVDGTNYETKIRASSEELLAGDPVAITACAANVSLASGEHEVSMAATNLWRPINTALVREGLDVDALHSQPLTPDKWSSDDRSVHVPQRDASAYLAINENFNRGWKANFEGKKLSSITIDGWKQGFVVPSGAAGFVTLTYTPSTPFTIALLVGFGLLLTLVAFGTLLAFRERESKEFVRAYSAPVMQSVLLIAGLGVIGGTTGAALAVLAVALSQFARRSQNDQAVFLGLGILVSTAGLAGFLLILNPAGGNGSYFGNEPFAQVLMLAAIAIAGAAWPDQRWNRFKGTSSKR